MIRKTSKLMLARRLMVKKFKIMQKPISWMFWVAAKQTMRTIQTASSLNTRRARGVQIRHQECKWPVKIILMPIRRQKWRERTPINRSRQVNWRAIVLRINSRTAIKSSRKFQMSSEVRARSWICPWPACKTMSYLMSSGWWIRKSLLCAPYSLRGNSMKSSKIRLDKRKKMQSLVIAKRQLLI